MLLPTEPDENQQAASDETSTRPHCAPLSSPTQKIQEEQDEEIKDDLTLRSDDVNSNSNASREGGHPARYAGQGTKENPYIVDWDENDPEYPFNWSRMKRWMLTYQVRLKYH